MYDVRRFGGQLVTIRSCPGGRGQRQGAHRADRDRGTKTANFVMERHLGFGCMHAISVVLLGDHDLLAPVDVAPEELF